MADGIFGTDRSFLADLKANGAAQLIVNGADIAPAVRGLSIDATAGTPPRITLDLAVFQSTRMESEQAEVVMHTATRDILLAAGWLPPEARDQLAELADNFDISGDVPGAGDGVRDLLAELSAAPGKEN